MATIGVEESLTDVREALADRGYEIVELKTENDAKGCDCCVVTGQDVNVMGIQNVVTEGSVIDARGMNAEEICRRIDNRLK
ncbi:MAG TPA: YkuS family protein [Bacillales bacterium]|nr:YkuS family protein [Bacillales bacterium]